MIKKNEKNRKNSGHQGNRAKGPYVKKRAQTQGLSRQGRRPPEVQSFIKERSTTKGGGVDTKRQKRELGEHKETAMGGKGKNPKRSARLKKE